ncbi:MAG: amidohydrolase family protein [Acidimicrobiales bacterium]
MRDGTPVDDIEEPERRDLSLRVLSVLERAAHSGLVEVWEAGLRDWAYLDALLELRERGALPLRVRLLVAAGLAEQAMRHRLGDTDLEIVGVKFYADGWLGPRTCALSDSFLDEPTNAGVLFESPDHLARRIEPFAADGWTIATHAIGDRAVDSVLEAYERVYGSECSSAAPRIEHAQILRADLVTRMAELGIVACIQPGFAFDDADHVHRALGKRWPMAYRWSALLDSGVRVITGSDFPIDGLEPLRGLVKLLHNPFDHLNREGAIALMTNADAGRMTLSANPYTVKDDELAALGILGTHPVR